MAGKVDIVMQFPGVQGNCGLTSYQQWIVVRSFYIGGEWENFARDGTNQNRKSGTLSLQYVRIARHIDVSTHGLFQSFAMQKSCPQVEIALVSGDGGQDKLFTCILETAVILHWGRAIGQQGSGGESMVLGAKQVNVTGYGYGLQGTQNSNTPVLYSYEQLKKL